MTSFIKPQSPTNVFNCYSRDGVRLNRLVELLLNGSSEGRLRMPALSRMQKVHNVDLALKALKASSIGIPKEIQAKDIVDGHLEKTLG